MKKNITISLCMIVKNEEDTLERCLSSIKDIVDEIIIVDTGSIDKTKEIALKYNSKIFDFEWIEDFSAARNFAFSKASEEYILWLDADDYLDDYNKNQFKVLKENLDNRYDSVIMNYSLIRDEKGNTTFSLKRNRLVKRSKIFKWIGKVHEYLHVDGLVFNSDITINHGKLKKSTDRNLKIFKKMIEDNIEFSSRDRFYYSNELYYNNFYKEAIENYKIFLSIPDIWEEDKKVAFNNMTQCYIELNDNDNIIKTILKAFEEVEPNGELCCKLADYLYKEKKYNQSIFWYKVAMVCIPSKDNFAYNNKDYYTWIPALNLSIAYYDIKKYDLAYYYNELAHSYDWADKSKTEYNREFYKDLYLKSGMKIPNYNINKI